MNHAIRITLPYADCSGIIRQWIDRCVSAIVYQHDIDEKVRKTHVHIGLYGCDVQAEALKRMWKNAPGKGNEFWSWKDLESIYSDGVEVRSSKYITYMSKGRFTPVLVKNISQQLVDTSRQEWVEPVKADRPGDASEYVIKKVMDKFDLVKQTIYHMDIETREITLGQCKYHLELLLTNVRSAAFRQLWGEHRRVPHSAHYKIIAATVFLRICEDNGCFEEGSVLIKNLWY